MMNQANSGGSFTLPGTSMTLNRMGYGAMQLAGPHVWGPPRDVDAAIAYCVRPLRSASTTSTPATSMVRMSPIKLSNERFIPIRKDS